MRSVVVVLPASMCAMMPMLRVRFSGTCRGITSLGCSVAGLLGSWVAATEPPGYSATPLPAIVGERLVRLGHAMSVLALLHRAAPEVGRVQQLIRQLLLHG